MTTDILSWLQDWYNEETDGDWEHEFGIRIYTVDNPGWRVTIDITGTRVENKPYTEIEQFSTEEDWVRVWVENGNFQGAGDPFKLSYILLEFRKWVLS